MVHPAIERVVPAGATLGECPVWSVADSRLYWVDIDGRRVHRFDPVSGRDNSIRTDGRPGAVMLSARPGQLLLAIELGLAWLDWTTGIVRPWVELEQPGTGNRLNDGRCDPAGRLWVGSMFADPSADIASGRLHRVETDGSSTVTRSHIGVPNGLAFSPDGRTMYFADTPTRTVMAYDYDPTIGFATTARPFFAFGEIPGKPDGACVDEDGCYWLACVYGSAVVRITPRGHLDRRIELPVARPSRCTFGGDDFDVLYITSIGADAHAHGDDPAIAGDVLAFAPGVSGLAEPAFAA
jgi:sugar lactone lactonase YvrE